VIARLDSLTVIVSTYNAPRYLELVLDGLMRQRDRDFECLVADDGSGPETAAVVERFRSRMQVAHSWQEDRGFRLAASRNRAIATASGSILAFLDGDCIPEPRYTADIKELFARASGGRFSGVYLQGHRVILDAEVSQTIASAEGIFRIPWILSHLRHLSNARNAVRLPWPSVPRTRLKGVRGCNMVYSAKDLWEVNGFDEEFTGWGHEDKDIVSRLFRSGVKRLDARGKLIVYHLYHKEQDRRDEEANLQRALSERPIRARCGIRRG
jgi:glycosyltransferase involved in cell wall biosynthesis